jgi:ribose-phosphate pyrophosphokinase
MTVPLLIPTPGNEQLAHELAAKLAGEVGPIELRQFPDGETYLRLLTSPSGRAVVIVCTLDHPDDKLLPLLFAAATARELKASVVGLVSPTSPICGRTGASCRARP